MNNVSLVGKLTKVYDATNANATMRFACGKIAVPRPYKVNGEFKSDTFQIRTWGKVADRLLMAKPCQIVGICGILEIDGKHITYINARNIYFYTNEQAESINEACLTDEQIEALSGFASVSDTDIPDF